MKREPGYYWVKFFGDWMVAEFTRAKVWYIVGVPETFSDEVFQEIDETEIERQQEPEGLMFLGIPEGGKKKRKR